MIYAAEIDHSNVVVRVVAAESTAALVSTIGGTWVETFLDGGSRKNYAGIGYIYDSVRNAFIPPQPYPSWVLVESTCQWDAPVPMPPTGKWVWDEASEDWVPA